MIISFCSLENHDNNINYMLVMEYADSGSLRNYLKNNFSKLNWDDKYLMAYQLACAVSCLHNLGIVHRDLVIIYYYSINCNFIFHTYLYILL
jgi:serine/threonine protein kinase